MITIVSDSSAANISTYGFQTPWKSLILQTVIRCKQFTRWVGGPFPMTPLCEVTCYWCSLWLIWWSRRARGCGCQGIESRLPFLEVLHAGGGVPRGHMGDFSIFGQLVKESALREWTFVLLKRVSSTTIMNLLSLREDLHALVVPPSRSRILPAWSFSLDSLLNNRNCPLSPW